MPAAALAYLDPAEFRPQPGVAVITILGLVSIRLAAD
jgi:hypothetical protein